MVFRTMADLKDLSNLTASLGDNPLVLSAVKEGEVSSDTSETSQRSSGEVIQSQEDADLDRKLREKKSIQELRKDWVFFILMDVIVFSAALIFILAVGSYSLFSFIKGDSSSEDEKKFAISVIALIVTTGLVSFVAGRSSASPK